jgi:capsular exopolysaccharide synthesis family protein
MIHAPIDATSLDSEPYRRLRTTLSFSQLREDRRAVVLTSARRGEGKTTTAVNFAVACAYGEQPTLLVDADLRSPQLHTVFGLPNLWGLSGLLRSDGQTLASAVVASDIPYLDVIPAGGLVPNAAELLAQPRMAELLSEARRDYEWIVIDSPPLLPVTDAAVVSRAADGVVLVVDVRRTPLRTARRAVDHLRDVDAPLLGVVLNNARSSARGGYGQYGAASF